MGDSPPSSLIAFECVVVLPQSVSSPNNHWKSYPSFKRNTGVQAPSNYERINLNVGVSGRSNLDSLIVELREFEGSKRV